MRKRVTWHPPVHRKGGSRREGKKIPYVDLHEELSLENWGGSSPSFQEFGDTKVVLHSTGSPDTKAEEHFPPVIIPSCRLDLPRGPTTARAFGNPIWNFNIVLKLALSVENEANLHQRNVRCEPAARRGSPTTRAASR